jgi:hypothetical protein
MNPALKAILAIALIGVVGVLLYTVMGEDPAQPGPGTDPGTQRSNEPETPTQPLTPLEVKPPVEEPTPVQPTRTTVEQPIVSGDEFEQGVYGILVNKFGQAVADSDVALYAGQGMRNLLEQMQRQQAGVVELPVAVTKTDASGGFRLGLAKIDAGQVFELRIQGKAHANLIRPNLTLFAGKWWDIGRLEVEAGLEVRGRVVAQPGGGPIANAIVTLKASPQGFGFSNALNTPGIEVLTDAGGNYRFDNATAGIASISAVAQGFARQERPMQNLRTDAENVFDFELPVGMSLSVLVTDAEGKPVPDAGWQVISMAPKTPLTLNGRTDREGRFEALGLVEGPYQVLVTADGFSKGEAKPVFAGETDRHLVLEKQGAVRVKVVTKQGRLIEKYTVIRKSWFEAQKMPGNLFSAKPQQVTSRDLDQGFCTLTGWDPGNYVLEIHTGTHAMTFSEPFQIAIGGATPELVVELVTGGALKGTIVSAANGAPLAKATIETKPNEFQDNPLIGIFGNITPSKVSQMTIQTTEAGRFRLDKLTPGTYQIRVLHPDHTLSTIKDIEIADGRETDIGTVQLIQGTLVTGTVRVNGTMAAQVKVQISTVTTPGQTDPRGMISADTVSDDQGRFTIPKRLPPGRYQASAGRQGEVFHMVVDYQQTKREFDLAPGQQQYILDFEIRAQ